MITSLTARSHIEVNPEHHGNLFFWHFQNRHLADRPRTVLWLNGGPGCSSEDGALMEIGPYRVRDGGKLEIIDGSWDEFANVLFVDNPVGTGFSYVDTDSYVHELPDMADQMVIFLEKFFSLFPQYSHDDVWYPCSSLETALTAFIVIHCWRVLRWPAHPLCRPCDSGPKQAALRCTLESQRASHRQWMDFWC
jgi:Serine carboxypeptidase